MPDSVLVFACSTEHEIIMVGLCPLFVVVLVQWLSGCFVAGWQDAKIHPREGPAALCRAAETAK